MDKDSVFDSACKAFDMLPGRDKAIFFRLAEAKVVEYVEAHEIDPTGLSAVYNIGLADNGELWITCDFKRNGEVVEATVPLVRLLAFKSTPFVHPVTEKVQ